MVFHHSPAAGSVIRASVIPPQNERGEKYNFLLMNQEALHEDVSFFRRQIIAILKQAVAGSPVPELCGEHGFSNATFYNGAPSVVASMRR